MSISTLSLCYVESLVPTWVRKENLLSQYFFNCNCSWCRPSPSPEDEDHSFRVISNDSRLNSFPLSDRDKRMLSIKCGCAEASCPKVGRPCSGFVLLTFKNGSSAHSSTFSTSFALKLKLSEKYVLDLTNASFTNCSLCGCQREASDSLLKAFVDVMETSPDALKAIDEARSEEGRILCLANEKEREKHFKMVLSMLQKLLRVSWKVRY